MRLRNYIWLAIGLLPVAGLLISGTLPVSGGATTSCQPADTGCGWTLSLLDSALGYWPMPRSMALDQDGNIFLAGESYPDAGDYTRTEILLAKYDAAGAQRWVKRFRAPGADGFNIAYGVAADAAGNLCIGGITDGSYSEPSQPRLRKGFAARLDGNGTRQWALDLPAEILAMAQDGEGNCYASSTQGVAKIDSHGDVAWSRSQPTSGIVVTQTGQLHIIGPGSAPARLRLVTLTGDGRQSRQLELALGAGLDWTELQFRRLALKADRHGHLYLHANVSGTDHQGKMRLEIYLAKLAGDGALVWERHYGIEGERWDSFDHALDQQGNIFLSGMSQSITTPGPMNTFVLKYDAMGEVMWVRQHAIADDNGAGSVAVDRHGNYFIAGGTRGALDGQPLAQDRSSTPFIARNRP